MVRIGAMVLSRRNRRRDVLRARQWPSAPPALVARNAF